MEEEKSAGYPERALSLLRDMDKLGTRPRPRRPRQRPMKRVMNRRRRMRRTKLIGMVTLKRTSKNK